MPKDCVQLLLSTLIPRLTSFRWSVCFGLCAILATGLGRLLLFAVCGDRENNVQRQPFFSSPTHNTTPHLVCMPCPLVWLAGPVSEYLVFQDINKSCNYYFPSLQTILITFAHILPDPCGGRKA